MVSGGSSRSWWVRVYFPQKQRGCPFHMALRPVIIGPVFSLSRVQGLVTFCYDFNLHLPISRPGKHILDMCFCLLCCVFCFVFEMTMDSLVKDDRELIFLTPHSQCWDCRPPSPHPATCWPFRVLLCLFESSVHSNWVFSY